MEDNQSVEEKSIKEWLKEQVKLGIILCWCEIGGSDGKKYNITFR